MLFWELKALYLKEEESLQPPPVCSLHLDDTTAAILHQNAHHTPSYWWRVMKSISVWGWLGGYDGQSPMGEFDQDAGLHPYSFSKDILGFLMTTEYQDFGLMPHAKDATFDSYYTEVLGPTQTAGWAPPAGLTNTSSSNNLDFSGGLPSRYWPGSALLSLCGQPVLNYRVIWHKQPIC